VRIHRLTTSHAPVFLVNSRLALVSAASSDSAREALHPTEAPLLPKLRGQFAEFLNQSSPDRLRILYVPTCVGLGYGHHVSSLEAFLGSVEWVTSPEADRHHISGLVCDGFTYRTPYLLAPGQPPPGRPILLRPPFATRRGMGRFGPKASPLATPLGLGADMVVQEYQPVVHRLRLSASP
jgi:hypothetical protein